MHSEPGEVEKNLERMESFVREASDKKAHAILFPELSISGYVLKNPEKIYDLSGVKKDRGEDRPHGP